MGAAKKELREGNLGACRLRGSNPCGHPCLQLQATILKFSMVFPLSLCLCKDSGAQARITASRNDSQ